MSSFHHRVATAAQISPQRAAPLFADPEVKSGERRTAWTEDELTRHYCAEIWAAHTAARTKIAECLASPRHVSVADRARLLTQLVADRVLDPGTDAFARPQFHSLMWSDVTCVTRLYPEFDKRRPDWYLMRYTFLGERFDTPHQS
jgi:hypothetical protein